MQTDRLAGAVTASRGIGRIRLRAGIDYDVMPDRELRRGLVDVSTRLGGHQLSARVQHDFRTKSQDIAGRWSRDLEGIRLGAEARYNSATQDVQGVLTLSFAMDRNPGGTGLRFGDRASSDRGSLFVRAFLDENSDGVFEDGEPLMPLSDLLTEPRGRTTEQSDGVRVDGLATNRRVGIALQDDALADPFAIPSDAGLVVTPRAGRTARIDYPVLSSAELEVDLVSDTGEPVANTVLTLKPCNTASHLSTIRQRTAFDGKAVFDRIRPGCYYIQTSMAEDRLPKVLLHADEQEQVTLMVPARDIKGR